MKKIVTISIIATLFVGAWFYFNQDTEVVEQEVVEEKVEQKKVTQDEDVDTSDWLTYRDEEYGFEFKYPEYWDLEDCSQYTSINVKYILSDNDVDCLIDKGGRINIISYSSDQLKGLIRPSYDMNNIYINGVIATQIKGVIELLGGEGERIDSEPIYKIIYTSFPYRNEHIVLTYSELYSLKDDVSKYGFEIEKNYTNIYSKIVSSFMFTN